MPKQLEKGSEIFEIFVVLPFCVDSTRVSHLAYLMLIQMINDDLLF